MSFQLSADSGNGSSITDPGVQQPVNVVKGKVTYQFDFPAEMVGMLIGRNGRNIKDLKERSGCEIAVKDKMFTQEFKLICLEGRCLFGLDMQMIFRGVITHYQGCVK